MLHCINHVGSMEGNRPYNVGLNSANLSKEENCVEGQGIAGFYIQLRPHFAEDPGKPRTLFPEQTAHEAGFVRPLPRRWGVKELLEGYAMEGPSFFSNARKGWQMTDITAAVLQVGWELAEIRLDDRPKVSAGGAGLTRPICSICLRAFLSGLSC